MAIVLALSGVEAIANATGVMKLDPGSTHEHPSVMKTAKPALLWIALEVCLLTAFLGLGMHALGGLHTVPGDSSGLDVDGPATPTACATTCSSTWASSSSARSSGRTPG